MQLQTELNSKAKEDLTRSGAPAYHLGASRATHVSVVPRALLNCSGSQSRGLAVHPSGVALKYF